MELLLGSHVREHGNRVGRLAGLELEPATLQVRRLIFSANGELGPDAITRPLAAIAHVHDDGEIELRAYSDAPMPSTADVFLLNRSTRLRRSDREVGRLVGVDVDAADRKVLSAFGRQHWWARRFSLDTGQIDFSTPGEIRARATGDTRAA